MKFLLNAQIIAFHAIAQIYFLTLIIQKIVIKNLKIFPLMY